MAQATATRTSAARPTGGRAGRSVVGAILALALIGLVGMLHPPAPAQGATATALATRPPTGEFEVAGGRIYDPRGVQFIPMGTNMNGPHSFFDVPTLGKAALLQSQWGFNTIRLVTCLPGGCHGFDRGDNDLDGIVAEYTGRGMVVIIDYHQLDFGAVPTSSQMTAAINFWTDIANRFGSNPYVWFNLFNEPDGNFNNGTAGGTATARWRSQHQRVIDAIRGRGARNLIVVDDTQIGQGAWDWWNINPSPSSDSGFLASDSALADPAGRLVASMHAYDMWGFPNGGDWSCRTRYTDAQRDSRLASYISRVKGKGFPLIIGELGYRPTDSPTSGTSIAGDGGSQPPCGSTSLLSADAVYRAAAAQELGVIAWHGFALTTAGPQSWTLTGSPPTNLTRWGSDHYNASQFILSRLALTTGATTTTTTSSTSSTTSSTTTTTTAPAGPVVQLVVGDPAAPTAGDLALRDRLIATRKATVQLRDDAAAELSTGINLRIVAESSDPAALGTKFRDSTVPLLSLDSGAWSGQRLANGRPTFAVSASVWVRTAGSPLTAGLAGNVTVADRVITLTTTSDNSLGAGATRTLAVSSGAPARNVEFAYATGAALVGGVKAPARRVGLGLGVDGDVPNLSANGWMIVDNAVGWLLAP